MQNHVLKYLNEIVKKCPDKVAYSNGEEELTFAEVYGQCRSVGTYCYNRGIYNRPVVVFMQKAPKEIVAFYGVIAGGNYYVPIDEEMPQSRIELILENVKTPLIICDESTVEIARGFELGDGEIVLYDDMIQTPVNDEAIDEIYRKAIDTDPIYIVFTSGSTGIPKGVVACHRSVIDYVEQLSEVLGFDENTVFGNQTPLYFDACLKEIYPTLKFGATTYLIPKSYFSFPIKLVEFLNQYKINTICWVVSALTMVSAVNTFKSIRPEYLRTIAFGSEVFPIKQFKRWKEAVPNATFTNLYGPTETTGMCCYYRVEREFADDEVIPIGHSFDNRQILLLDADGRQVKQGEEGEICIRGTALTLGYYNDPERTAAAFVQNPLNSLYSELIYKTGDLARYNEAGELIFASRKDYQIKHMGHRIELGEIEVNVNRLEGIHIAACVYDTNKKKIVLYFVGELTEGELASALKTKLPRYMIPNKIVKLDEMPFTANGKSDRVTLKKNCEQ